LTEKSSVTKKCWICEGEAISKEHIIQKSDLKALFGTPNQQDPLIFNSSVKRNKPLGSLKAEDLKYPANMCHSCNTSLTQSHDLAWEFFSEKIRALIRNIDSGDNIRCNKIFAYDTSHQMLNIHLFF
jgi:hypothetical protein